MTTASIYEAKSTLSKLIEKVLHGEEVVISRHGKPVVRLMKCEEEPPPRILGAWAGKVTVSDDFDAPSSEIEDLFHEEGIFPGEDGDKWVAREASPPYGRARILARETKKKKSKAPVHHSKKAKK